MILIGKYWRYVWRVGAVVAVLVIGFVMVVLVQPFKDRTPQPVVTAMIELSACV